MFDAVLLIIITSLNYLDRERRSECLELSVILANRSATLYHLERYEHALEDMEEASQLGYPKDLFYKLEERRARCLLALKRHDAAIEAFRRALQTLDDTRIPLERKQKFQMDIRMMLAVMDKGKQLNKAVPNNLSRVNDKQGLASQRSEENRGKFIPERQKNPRYPACSSAVEIKDNGGDVGRHAVATREIAPGEVVIMERPHCAFLLAENRQVQVFRIIRSLHFFHFISLTIRYIIII